MYVNVFVFDRSRIHGPKTTTESLSDQMIRRETWGFACITSLYWIKNGKKAKQAEFQKIIENQSSQPLQAWVCGIFANCR